MEDTQKVRLEYWTGEEWELVDMYPSEKFARITLGSDTFNYRIVENGKVTWQDTIFDKPQNNNHDTE